MASAYEHEVAYELHTASTKDGFPLRGRSAPSGMPSYVSMASAYEHEAASELHTAERMAVFLLEGAQPPQASALLRKHGLCL